MVYRPLVPAGQRPQRGCASQKAPETDDYYVQDLYRADVEEGSPHKVCCRRERQELMNMRVPLGQPLGRVVNRRKQYNHEGNRLRHDRQK